MTARGETTRSHRNGCHGTGLGAASLKGFTLVEMMVAMGLGVFVLAVVATLTMFTVRSFVAMGNYNDLERASTRALDTMSREVRQAAYVVSFSTNRVQLRTLNGTPLVYEYDPQAETLSQIKGGVRQVLLRQCDYLSFNISQRNPSNDFNFYPASTVAQAKLLDVSWRCSRQILGAKLNTESVQTAKIVIRN
jgi:type II secretory pathway pseudopilin PulG